MQQARKIPWSKAINTHSHYIISTSRTDTSTPQINQSTVARQCATVMLTDVMTHTVSRGYVSVELHIETFPLRWVGSTTKANKSRKINK